LRILLKLNQAEAFETFLQTKFVGQKRFSLEGGETTIPVIDEICEAAAEADLDEVTIGMAHRGRLNVLANIVGKKYSQIFREFEGNIDPRTGHRSLFSDGLPKRVVEGFGGAVDVAFVHGTAYALVTLVGSDVGGSSTVGIYRIDGRHKATVVADIGTWAIEHPPVPDFFVPSGVQYALQPYRGDLLVTDGHHNRVLRIDLDGAVGANVSEVIAF
ncbi:hypothetical protein ACFPB1_27390, partial [Paenibacillus sp. GCM10023250]